MRLGRDFFNRNVVEVAEDLIGKVMVYSSYRCIITETEAYGGLDDPASHAFKGPTPRAKIMFGESGVAYVYMIYGMHYCFNIVANDKENAGAVLVRSAQILTPEPKILNGPGKLCKYLGITKTHNGIDLIEAEDFYLEDHQIKLNYSPTARIGITKAQDRLWRFASSLPQG